MAISKHWMEMTPKKELRIFRLKCYLCGEKRKSSLMKCPECVNAAYVRRTLIQAGVTLFTCINTSFHRNTGTNGSAPILYPDLAREPAV